MKQIHDILNTFIFLLFLIISSAVATEPQIIGDQSGSERISKTYRYHINVLDENFQPTKYCKYLTLGAMMVDAFQPKRYVGKTAKVIHSCGSRGLLA